MAALDGVSISILLGAVLVLAGMLSSLVALRFGAPLLLVFLVIGMLAGEAGPGGIRFEDVRLTYLVGSIALALILFDGGLKTRIATFRAVLAPSIMLATMGVLFTAALTAPVAKFAADLNWMEALLVGSVVASTDAAAVFFLVHANGLRLRPRVGATLEIESGTNDPFAIFLTLMLVQLLASGEPLGAGLILELAKEAVAGVAFGYLGGRAIVAVLNRMSLPQGLHAPLVITAVLALFGIAQTLHTSGFLAVYVAGLIVGNRPTRAHNSIVAFLDAVTWLAQIGMFMLLGLLAWPDRLLGHGLAGLAVAATLMLFARPISVFLCLWPFRFSLREKTFISWVGLRGAVGIFLASIPLLVGLPNAQLYFDLGFVVVIVSLLVQGWTIASAARRLHIALPRAESPPRRVELDLPGQLEQELVGYSVGPNSPYLRRRLAPSWAKLTLVVRGGQVLNAEEADGIHQGDYVYFLAPPERAQSLDRFFVNMPPPSVPGQGLIEDFIVPAEATLGALGEIYGVDVAEIDKPVSLATHFANQLRRIPHEGDRLPLGAIVLVAHTVVGGFVTQVGLQLAEPDPVAPVAAKPRLKTLVNAWLARGVALLRP